MRSARREFLKTATVIVGGCAVAPGPTLAACTRSDDLAAVAVPAIGERGVYLNVGHSIPPLTVNEWTEQRWQAYLDALAAAKFNSLQFGIWQDVLSDYAADPADKERNRHLHENLKRVVESARARGFRVVFHVTPTYGPRVLWQEHPELLADIDYARHGFLSLCPSREGSWPLIRAFVAHELAWFSSVDAVQVWFYDPGGCLCAQCRAELAAPLVRQVRECRELMDVHSPQAELRVSTWPIWAWEAQLKEKYGAVLIDRLAALPEKFRPAAVFDSAQRADAYLGHARERGLAAQAFFFSANVESPFVFFHPHFEFYRTTVQRVIDGQCEGAAIHSIAAGAKWLDTWIAGQCLGHPQADVDELSRAAARFATGDDNSAALLAPALVEWHDLLRRGTTGDGFAAVRQQVEQAAAALPEARREELDWLTASASATDLICRAAAGDAELEAAKGPLQDLLAASPTFARYAAYGVAALPHLARFVRRGWDAEHF